MQSHSGIEHRLQGWERPASPPAPPDLSLGVTSWWGRGRQGGGDPRIPLSSSPLRSAGAGLDSPDGAARGRGGGVLPCYPHPRGGGSSVCVCVCMYVYMCVCLCVAAPAPTSLPPWEDGPGCPPHPPPHRAGGARGRGSFSVINGAGGHGESG